MHFYQWFANSKTLCNVIISNIIKYNSTKKFTELCKCKSQTIRICHNKGKKVLSQSSVGIPMCPEDKINNKHLHHASQITNCFQIYPIIEITE